MKKVFSIIVGFAASFAMAISLYLLWGWFVVPLGIPSIGMLHAWGLIYVAEAIKFDSTEMARVMKMDNPTDFAMEQSYAHAMGAVTVGLTGFGIHWLTTIF